MIPHSRLSGLIAATYTPMDQRGRLRIDAIEPLVRRLLEVGIGGLYVCGSTGEGMSLTTEERKQVAQGFIQAVDQRVPVIVQVGHNSLEDACDLAAHAAATGADVVSATCPSYFKGTDPATLITSMASIAKAAPNLPFYYYHIPALTGSTIDIVQWLTQAQQQIPNLAGLKYTDTKLFEFQACQAVAGGQLDIVFGCDEMLLGAIASGATAAIGSTYNVMAPLYQRLIDQFQRGDLAAARASQLRSIEIIRMLGRYPFHSALKEVLKLQGIDCGICRLPQRPLTPAERRSLKQDLDALQFFELPEGGSQS